MTHIYKLFTLNAVIFHEKIAIVIFHFTGTLMQRFLSEDLSIKMSIKVSLKGMFTKLYLSNE